MSAKVSLYQRLVAVGAKIDNYGSDIHVKSSPEVDAIIEEWRGEDWCSRFIGSYISDADKERWWYLPLMFDPWWDRLFAEVRNARP